MDFFLGAGKDNKISKDCGVCIPSHVSTHLHAGAFVKVFRLLCCTPLTDEYPLASTLQLCYLSHRAISASGFAR